MNLRLKQEYLNWSIGGGGKLNKIKLKNISTCQYEKLYNDGYSHFFDVIDDSISKDDLNSLDAIKITKKTKSKDDINLGE